MNKLFRASVAALTAAAFATSALAQVAVLDQTTVPFTTTSTTELLTQSLAVTGGTLYFSTLKQGGAGGMPIAVAQSFVPVAAGGLVRYLPLIHAKSDTGITLAASASTGLFGITRSAGSTLYLVGNANAGTGTTTDKAIWEFNLPDTYVAGASIAFVVNAVEYNTTSCVINTATLTPTLYTEVNGVEAAASGAITAAATLTIAAANYTFTQVGTGLTPGAHVTLELVVATTPTSGTCTPRINAVSYTG